MSTLPVSAHSQLQIRQHNALTTARYGYSELQLDLLFFIVSKLRPSTDDMVYRLSTAELSSLTGKKYNPKYLHQATAEMGKRMFEVNVTGVYQQLWMFQSVTYLDSKGIINVKLSEDIIPYLFDLQKNFTSYQLHAALKLSSKFAKRVYPICSQWKDKGQTPYYSIYDFKSMLGLVDEKGVESYLQYGPFKKTVLMVALTQINEHTDLQIDLVEKKEGRAITSVSFKVGLKSDDPAQPAELIKDPGAPEGITQQKYETAVKILDDYNIVDNMLRHQILTSPDLLAKLFSFNYKVNKGDIKPTKSRSGLLLVTLGLKSASKSAPKD